MNTTAARNATLLKICVTLKKKKKLCEIEYSLNVDKTETLGLVVLCFERSGQKGDEVQESGQKIGCILKIWTKCGGFGITIDRSGQNGVERV